LPLYTVSLILDFTSVSLGRLAAWIAGDDWPNGRLPRPQRALGKPSPGPAR
jgi:hypothetical protein